MSSLTKRVLGIALATCMITSSIAASGVVVSAQDKGQTDQFFSSFEEDEDLFGSVKENTVDVAEDGSLRYKNVEQAPGSQSVVGEYIGYFDEVTARYDGNGSGEGLAKLTDRDTSTKYLTSVFGSAKPTVEDPLWINFKMTEPVVVRNYAITSANDIPGRDPVDWKFYGSETGEDGSWVELDVQTNASFAGRFQTNVYDFENETAYGYYRLEISKNGGENLTQMAEFAVGSGIGEGGSTEVVGMTAKLGGGPGSTVSGHSSTSGWTGDKTYVAGGIHMGTGEAYSNNVIYDNLSIEVKPDTQLSYMIFPQYQGGDEDYDYEYTSMYAAVDLHFTDGTYLSELNAIDQNGNVVEARAQGESKTLTTRQWNHIYSNIGSVADGKVIDKILVSYNKPSNSNQVIDDETGEEIDGSWFQTFFDDISIKEVEPVEYEHLSDYVNILRGTSSYEWGVSRGLTVPMVNTPHAFNFWVPANNSGSPRHYDYQLTKDRTFKHITISHEASFWIGDRGTYQFMVNTSVDNPTKDNVQASARGSAYTHENEEAKAHYYSVTFNEGTPASGSKLELTPTDHAAMMRFTFDDTAAHRNVILDSTMGEASVEFSEDGKSFKAISHHDVGNNGASKIFVYGEFDVAGTPTVTDASHGQALIAFPDGTKEVNLKVATSYISHDQAKHNLELEISEDDTFDTVEARAQQTWDDQLGIVEIEDATYEQMVSFYSGMYRLFSFPNTLSENVNTNEDPKWQYRSPYGDDNDNKPIKDGILYYNNGFWDTYRTTWAAYALFTPTKDAELLNGLSQHYIDQGWIPRWIAPGGSPSMVGTSSDVIFGDALMRGIDFDVDSAYLASVRNASCVTNNLTNGGRAEVQNSPYYGYTGNNYGSGMSWSIESYINDYGIANMAKIQRDQIADTESAEYKHFNDEYVYYMNRAQNYVKLFNPNIGGWFRGKSYDGKWTTSDEDFDPFEWSSDYTETNGWNMAFSVTQDGQGLANLYGGRDKLAEKLDEYFTTSTEYHLSSGSGVIHEQREARDNKLGQYGGNNQPSHHIPYMYNYAGQPYKTQEVVRDIVSRLYVGNTIGQGYPGDEDNGEMSAWYIFSALGIYPVNMGSGEFAIGSPLFKKATIHLENGNDVIINAPENSKENLYVQSLKVEGEDYDKTFITHSDLINGDKDGDGNITLDFEMGSEPSAWGTSEESLPTSITTDDEVAEPMDDFTSANVKFVDSADELTGNNAGVYASNLTKESARLFNNTSDGGSPEFSQNNTSIVYYFGKNNGKKVELYTLTNVSSSTAPTAWTLSASNDGETWVELDSRSNESYRWDRTVRPFAIDNDEKYEYYKLDVTGGDKLEISEMELLGYISESTDKDSLGAAIEYAKGYDVTGYAQPSIDALNSVIAEAEALYAQEDLTVSQILDMIDKINAAIANLQPMRNGLEKIEAESFDDMKGTIIVEGSGDLINIGSCYPDSYIGYQYVDFTGTNGTDSITIRHSGPNGDIDDTARVEVRLDSPDGELMGTIYVPPTGSWSNYQEITGKLDKTITGTHTIYFVLKAESKFVGNFDYFLFHEKESLDDKPVIDLKLDRDPAIYEINENFTMTFKTADSISDILLQNEGGKWISKTAIKSVNNGDGTKSWTVKASLGTPGEDRALRIFLKDDRGMIENSGVDAVLTVAVFAVSPVLEAKVDRDPAAYKINEDITFSITTSKDVEQLKLTNERGKTIGLKSSAYDDSGDNRVWTLVASVGTIGERTFGISAKQDGYWQDSEKSVNVTIEATAEALLYEAIFQADEVAVNEPVQVRAVTSLGVTKLGVRNENGRAVSFTVDSCVDEGDERIWTISLSFGTAGDRLFDFVAADESGKWLGYSVQDSILVTK
ncbi:GH92 family glycosyl hydrolase [Solibaculum mannosilyticum]|uniref:GH92 family glycosyl hydrolase n=1 Tax=Solibaculum mannosilyticum TaxID=2780922 RepID=UPI0034C44B19